MLEGCTRVHRTGTLHIASTLSHSLLTRLAVRHVVQISYLTGLMNVNDFSPLKHGVEEFPAVHR